MKFYPYSKLKSENLGLLLFFTRAITTLSFALFIWLLKDIYSYAVAENLFLNTLAKAELLLTFNRFLVLFSLSGFFAAIVSLEYSITKSKNI